MSEERPWRGAAAALAWGSGAVLLAGLPAAVEVLPVLGVLRGPLGPCLIVLACAVALGRLLSGRLRVPDPPPLVLFVTAAGLFLGLGLHYTARLRVSGDEPHYLIMAQSLSREADLDLRDNYARGDYLEYTPGPLQPHYGAPRPDGRAFPAHSPGLPALLAPVYALGGRRACVVLLALVGAALTLEVRTLALRVTGEARAGFAAWAAVLGPPAAFYAFHVYTEIPSALALASCLRILLSAPAPARAVAAALLAGLLPWLHVKMIPAAAALGLIGLVSIRGRSRAAFLATAVVMALAFFGYYQMVFGRPTPLALYGGLPGDATAAPLRALAGLFLDRSFGLLPHAPVFLLALSGLPLLLRRGRWAYALLGAAVLGPVLFWRMWWGGQCPPARFLVPLLPALGAAVALRAGGPARGLARWRWALPALGLALALFMSARPSALLLLNRGDRPTRVWAALSAETPVGRYLPSLVSSEPSETRVAAIWAGGLALLLVLDRLAQRRTAVDRLFRGLGLPLGVLLLVGALVDGWARAQGSEGSTPAAAISWTAAAASGRAGGPPPPAPSG